jgi:xanthine dehydrogenase YagR molybdenum-binding subunit
MAGTSSGVIGADIPRVDGIDKVMGRPIFGADRLLPNMAHALPVAATVGKGRITRIDTAKAEQVPGVPVVLTHVNMDRLQPVRFVFAGGQGIQSFQPLQADRVLYRGQPIALVVAENLEAASEAAALIDVEYEPEPFAVQLDAEGREVVIQAEATPWFHDFVAGDADGALKTAPVVIEQTYMTPPQHQNPIELLSSVAEWQDGHLTIHEGTQGAQTVWMGLATALGIDPEKVHVTSPFVGGGFGQKNSMIFHTVMAAVAARRVGRPVKIVLPRAQVFHGTSFRPAVRHTLKLGAEASGRIVACVHESDAQTSRHDLMPFNGAETTARMYGIPNYRGMARLIKLDTHTPGFMRAPFEMSAFFALECGIDELAYRLQKDPVELRIANDAQADPISGKPYSLRRLKECLQRGADKFGWARRSPQPMSMREPDGTLIGWGMAAGAYPASIVPNAATVRLYADGTADVSVGGHEMGQGIRTAIALVAAEELGIDPTHVRITIGDSSGDSSAPPQHITAGAWGTASATPPVQEAARRARAQAEAGELSKPGVAYVEGRVERVGAGAPADAMGHARQGLVSLVGPEFPDFVAFAFIAHFVEVRVEPRLRRTRVTRIVSVVDCGRVVSRRTAHSQVYGGLVWSVGAALSEETEVDPRFGGWLNSNIAEYQIPVNADIRNFEIDFIDEPDTRFNSVGAKGLGEVPCCGAAAAIANAVYHASGRRVRKLPIRIEDLLD